MNRADIGNVSIDRIVEADIAYRITTETRLEGLVRSVEAVGVLNPPILAPCGENWEVIAGARRVAACRRLGRSRIFCRKLSPAIPPLERAKMAVADNAGQRALNVLELSRAYRLLSLHLSSKKQLVREARTLGLPHNPGLIEKIQGLCLLPEPIQQGVLSEAISLSIVKNLEQMPEPEALGFARWFSVAPMSLSRQREVLTLVREIARREERPVMEVLEAPEFATVLEDLQWEGPRRGRRLHLILRRRRFPALSRAEADFERRRKRLGLSSGMELLPAKNFEAGRFELKLTFSGLEALEKMVKAAGKLTKDPELAEILQEEKKSGPSEE